MQRLRAWRAVEIAVAGATVVALAARLAFPAWPWHELLRLALFGSIFWLLPLYALVQAQQMAPVALERVLRVYPLLLIAILLAALTRPGFLVGALGSAGAAWLAALAAIIPVLTWPIVRWMRRAFPTHSGRLGLVGDRWALNLALGALAGAGLGLHLLLAARVWPGLPQPDSPLAPRLIWAFFVQAGLMGLGQELLLRGLAYDALFAGVQSGFSRATVKIVLLNLLVYLATLAVLPITGLFSIAWLLAYGAALAFVATFLRHRQQSLLPGLAAGVVFSLFVAALGGL